MDVHIHLEGRESLARQIYWQIRAAILDGRLRRGDRLPATRELAHRLEVSRNTVSLAYEWLVAEGLLFGRKGAGSFVEGVPLTRAPRQTEPGIRQRLVWKGIEAPVRRDRPPRYDFGVGIPDASLFPFDTWRRLLARQIRGSMLSGDYGDPAGHPRLRAVVARNVGLERGVDAAAEDVIVTHGAQGAFDLIARILIEPGVTVAVEEPGYPPARLLFASHGARVALVPVDTEGLDPGVLPDDARLVYVTPSHQFPLGMPMSYPRRIALLEWAERRNAVVVEDGYDSEFRFGGRPLQTLQSLDRGGRVIYVGSFSKTLLPALRLGFLVAPPSLREALRAGSYVSSSYPPWPSQAALASLIDEGLFGRHIRKARREYATRHERILLTLGKDFDEWVEPIISSTGIHLAARFRAGGIRLERAVVERAWKVGVGVDPLSTYCVGRPQAGLVLGYGAIAEGRIRNGLDRLRECFVTETRRA